MSAGVVPASLSSVNGVVSPPKVFVSSRSGEASMGIIFVDTSCMDARRDIREARSHVEDP